MESGAEILLCVQVSTRANTLITRAYSYESVYFMASIKKIDEYSIQYTSHFFSTYAMQKWIVGI